jgi:hypothetical protein
MERQHPRASRGVIYIEYGCTKTGYARIRMRWWSRGERCGGWNEARGLLVLGSSQRVAWRRVPPRACHTVSLLACLYRNRSRLAVNPLRDCECVLAARLGP